MAPLWSCVTTAVTPNYTGCKSCSAPGVFLGFVLENYMLKMNRVFLCNYKICVNHLGIKIKLTVARLHKSWIKPDVPSRLRYLWASGVEEVKQ